MNYEKFNDAMCELKQAEENLNKALQNVAVAINETERKPQKFQKNNDEEYRKGLKDMHEALRIIAAEDEMSVFDLNDTFGTCSICDIILGFTPKEIIDKVLEWKNKRKESQNLELRIGDEMENVVYPEYKNRKFIIYKIDLPYIRVIEPITYDKLTFYKKSLKKTGKHYDSIPLKKEETNK